MSCIMLWLATEIVCNVEPPLNGGVSAGSVSIGDSINYTCNCGYYLADEAGNATLNTIATCLETGELSNNIFCLRGLC